MKHPKKIGILGSKGLYGQWLMQFFEQVMHCDVIGLDRDATETQRLEMALEVDVLVFSVPPSETSKLIAMLVEKMKGRERDKLWLDITSLKSAPVEALLQSKAEVVGLHPMTAPPIYGTLKGRVMVFCPMRTQLWLDWVLFFLDKTEATIEISSPDYHDKVMSSVQGLVHAVHLIMAAVLCDLQAKPDHLQKTLEYKTPLYAICISVMSRLLARNESMYADIQYLNPNSIRMLKQLVQRATDFLNHIEQGQTDYSEQFKTAFIETFFKQSQTFFGQDLIHWGDEYFEILTGFMSDIAGDNIIVIESSYDKPGILYGVVKIFNDFNINMQSLHTMRLGKNTHQFRIGLSQKRVSKEVQSALAEIHKIENLSILPSIHYRH